MVLGFPLPVGRVVLRHEFEVAKSEGFTSTTGFLESRAGLSKGESRAQVALGEKLQWEFEATAQACPALLRAGA